MNSNDLLQCGESRAFRRDLCGDAAYAAAGVLAKNWAENMQVDGQGNLPNLLRDVDEVIANLRVWREAVSRRYLGGVQVPTAEVVVSVRELSGEVMVERITETLTHNDYGRGLEFWAYEGVFRMGRERVKVYVSRYLTDDNSDGFVCRYNSDATLPRDQWPVLWHIPNADLAVNRKGDNGEPLVSPKHDLCRIRDGIGYALFLEDRDRLLEIAFGMIG